MAPDVVPLTAADPLVARAVARVLLARRRAADPLRVFSKYDQDPVAFLSDQLGVTHWYPELEAICESVLDAKVTDVQAGHGVGKTFVVGRLALWWVYARGGAFVSTAPGFRQVRRQLWKEIRRGWQVLYRRYGDAVGRCDLLQLAVDEWRYGYGFAARDWDPDSALGEHEGRLLVIADEANGIKTAVWDALASYTTGEENRRINLSNPTASGTPFYRSCNAPERKGTHRAIRIPVWSHPNIKKGREIVKGAVTQGWVDMVREEYGEESSYWQSRVEALFPEEQEGALVPRAVFEAAVERWRADPEKWDKGGPTRFGVDLGERRDRTAVTEVRGAALLGVKSKEPVRDDRDLARAVVWVRELLKGAPGSHANLDGIGVGAGVASVLISEGLSVTSVRVSESPDDPAEYRLLRDELYGTLRERFYKGTIAVRPPRNREETREYEGLKDELAAIRWDRDVHGRVVVEETQNIRDRLGRSPDRAASAALAMYAKGEGVRGWKPSKGPKRASPWKGR